MTVTFSEFFYLDAHHQAIAGVQITSESTEVAELLQEALLLRKKYITEFTPWAYTIDTSCGVAPPQEIPGPSEVLLPTL